MKRVDETYESEHCPRTPEYTVEVKRQKTEDGKIYEIRVGSITLSSARSLAELVDFLMPLNCKDAWFTAENE